MPLTNQNFSVYAGDTAKVNFTITDSSNNAVDLTGSTITWAMQFSVADPTPVLSKSTGNGISITNATGGVFQLVLNHSDTQGLLPFSYYHQAVVTDSMGNVSTVSVGTVTVIASATSLP